MAGLIQVNADVLTVSKDQSCPDCVTQGEGTLWRPGGTGSTMALVIAV